MRLYINGHDVAGKLVGKGGVQGVIADLRIGKAGTLREPTEAPILIFQVISALMGLLMK